MSSDPLYTSSNHISYNLYYFSFALPLGASWFYPSLVESCLSVDHFSDLRRVTPICPYISL